MTAAVRTAPQYRLTTRRKWYRRVTNRIKVKLPKMRLRPRPRTTTNRVRTRPRQRRGPPRLARERAV